MRRDAKAVGMEDDGGAVACSNAILHCCCSIIRQAPHPGGKDDDANLIKCPTFYSPNVIGSCSDDYLIVTDYPKSRSRHQLYFVRTMLKWAETLLLDLGAVNTTALSSVSDMVADPLLPTT